MASEACCTPAPPAEHFAEGKVGTIGGLPAYLNNPSSKSAIILAMDIFGFEAPLLRKLADKIAAAGYYAIVPDYFRGEPYVPKDPANKFEGCGPWIAVHHPDASVDVTKTIIKELKGQGVESVGIAGFCWGGRLAVQIGKEEDLVKGVVLCHPSLTTAENITDLKVATVVLAAEIDQSTPVALAEEFKRILATKPFPNLVKIFPGQAHGWTIRYDVNVPFQVKGALEAHADILAFYKSVL